MMKSCRVLWLSIFLALLLLYFVWQYRLATAVLSEYDSNNINISTSLGNMYHHHRVKIGIPDFLEIRSTHHHHQRDQGHLPLDRLNQNEPEENKKLNPEESSDMEENEYRNKSKLLPLSKSNKDDDEEEEEEEEKRPLAAATTMKNNQKMMVSQEDQEFVKSMVSRLLQLSIKQTKNQTLSSSHPLTSLSLSGSSSPYSCALNFHGLPRAFRSLVLPSIIRNVLIPNVQYNCNIFAFVHSKEKESEGRSGAGGAIDPNAIYLLETAAQQVALQTTAVAGRRRAPQSHQQPVVRIETFSDDDFYAERGDFVHQTQTAVDDEGRPLYLPWRAAGFTNESLVNIARMWHGIAGAWNLLEEEQQGKGIQHYTRVGIFRSDVYFFTPIDIYRIPASPQLKAKKKRKASTSNRRETPLWDFEHNHYAVIPGFAKYPVNDRMIFGPYHAVKVYATQRFALVHQHVRLPSVLGQPKNGMHSENMLAKTIFPLIRKQFNVQVVEDPDICFVRARADGSLWVSDCDRGRADVDDNGEGWDDKILKSAQETLQQPKCTKQKKYVKGSGVIFLGTCP